MEEDVKKTPDKLYRSKADRYLGGVCGGIATYFNIDSNLTRILFVVTSFFWGIGVIIYLAALIIVPENPAETEVPQERTMNNTLFWGILFVSLGALLLLWELNLFNFFNIMDLPWATIWAVFLIAIGVAMLYAQWKKESEDEDIDHAADMPGDKESGARDFNFNIQRSRTDRKLAGICGGIAKHYNIDSSLIRLAWILVTIASKGLGLLIYIIFIFVFPEESSEQTA